MIQTNFNRHEIKYILTIEQYNLLLQKMPADMILDSYGRHKISNIYFDTEDYRIIRHSLERPSYKEKLRVRTYGEITKETIAFIELKKKINGVVYKRRVFSQQDKVFAYLCDGVNTIENSQILNEIDYFKSCYNDFKPKVYLSYEREAFFSINDENFRLTFDFNIKTRNKDISLYSSDIDKEVLSSEYVLLEAKTFMGFPSWFIDFLSSNCIYKSSFSKYGKAYQTYYMSEFIAGLRRNNND